MGSSRAYAVYRADDTAEACRRARLLCARMQRLDGEVWLCARLHTVEEARAMGELLPAGLFESSYDPDSDAYDPDLWYPGSDLPAHDRELAAVLPLTVDGYAAPGPAVEESFLRALGDGAGTMLWRGVREERPEIADQSEDSTNQRVELDLNEEHPDGRHTVHVHFRYEDPAGAAHLAAAIGGAVLGPVQVGR
ncbi:hypothetical protein ACIQZO_13640 [Streptomyces sp. NPDC097617]|uniref:hypothetical protein n=1 Tax=Streptomyces sp. NPDC097617 TaxID=3366091 RepID=UPI0037F6A111